VNASVPALRLETDDTPCPRPCCDRWAAIPFADLLTSAQENYQVEQRHFASALESLQALRQRGWLDRMSVESISAAIDELLRHQSEWAAAEARLSLLSHFADWGMRHADR
jgi:hypothetical protein